MGKFKRCLLVFSGIMATALIGLTLLVLPHIRLKTPPPSHLLLDSNGRFLAQSLSGPGGRYGYWPLEKLPQRVVAATLALEDKRFWYHPGVDPIAVLRAIRQNLSSGRRVSGASTIAMQVARLQNPGPRTYFRKTMEALSAVFLTLRYGREKLLKHYLTIVPFGNNGHGIRYAARTYLNKPVDDLSWAEIAFLASIPHAPSRMNPHHINGIWRCKQRGQKILKALFKKGWLTKTEWHLAAAQIKALEIPEAGKRPENALHAILHIENLLKNSATSLQTDVHTNLQIQTTIDMQLQNKVSQLAAQEMARWRRQGADQTAVIVTKYPRMEVLAYMGSEQYYNSPAGSINYGTVKRSSGSALKPFIYALALEKGIITPTTILDDLPSVAGGIRNADFQFLGPLLPRQALANSRNVTAVNLVAEVGLEETFQYLKTLGLHENQHDAGYYGLGIAIGSLPVDLLSLVSAYGVLANGGQTTDIIWFLDQKQPSCRRLISESNARLITLFLSDPMARLPSFPRMGTTEFPFPVALKTGTSKGYRDAWTVAFSKKYLVGVWVGRSDNKPMHKLSGAGSAACLVKDILMCLHRNQMSGMADRSFPVPEALEQVTICAYTGKVDRGFCESTFQEWLVKDQIPSKDQRHLKLLVDTRNGLLAGPWTPNRFVKSSFFIDLPLKYRKWAEKHGILPPPVVYSRLNMPENNKRYYAKLQRPRDYTLKGMQQVMLEIHSPLDGTKIRPNTNLPKMMNSIGLKVSTDPKVDEVLWYVDGLPYKLCDPLADQRWPLSRGQHTFQVRLPYRAEASKIVKIEVQ